MRILHVTRETDSDRRFGIGRCLDALVHGLRDAGHEVEYLTQQSFGPREHARREWWTARLRSVFRPWFGPAIDTLAAVWGERVNMGAHAARVADRWRSDCVHLHDPWLALGFALATRLQALQRRPWGLTQHGFGCYTEAIREEGIPTTPALLRQQRALEGRVLAAAHFVVCPTAASREQLRRDLVRPEPPAHWHAIPHALSKQSVPPRDQARRALGWGDGTAQVLAVGRLNPVKRMEHVLRACAALRRPMRLTILGEGDDQPLHQWLAAQPGACLELEVKRVDDVFPYLAATDVYVSAARNESFGLANLEALAAGCAAVCTAVGGVPEVTGGAAWLLPGDDSGLQAAMSQAIETLLDAPALRAQWGARALRHAQAWPGAAEVAKRHETIYRALA